MRLTSMLKWKANQPKIRVTIGELVRYKVRLIPAIIIIQDPTILIMPVERRRKLIITWRPIPTVTVTKIMSTNKPSIKPPIPTPIADRPSVLR